MIAVAARRVFFVSFHIVNYFLFFLFVGVCDRFIRGRFADERVAVSILHGFFKLIPFVLIQREWEPRNIRAAVSKPR